MGATWRFPSRFGAGLLFLVALVAGGCDAAGAYRATLRDQTRALEELAKILGSVTDKNSMEAAGAKLDQRFGDFEGIRHRAQQLPPPTQEVLGQLREEGEKVRQALEKVQEQVRRISALPEGQKFLAGFERMHGFLGERTP